MVRDGPQDAGAWGIESRVKQTALGLREACWLRVGATPRSAKCGYLIEFAGKDSASQAAADVNRRTRGVERGKQSVSCC